MTPESFARRALIAAVAVLALACTARPSPHRSLAPGSAGDARRTIWDGVYTEEQRQRGEATYGTACVLCHRPELTGSLVVPPLVGEKFLSRWTNRTAGDLFERMRTSMPPNATQRLSPQEYADVLAYIFSKNEFPAGGEDLADDFAALQVIRLSPGE